MSMESELKIIYWKRLRTSIKVKVYDRFVGALLTSDEYHRLESVAKDHGKSISQILRLLIDLTYENEVIRMMNERRTE